MIKLKQLDKDGVRWAQRVVTAEHYLHRPVDARCSVEGYAVYLATGIQPPSWPIGLLLFGRPEATRCQDWYGSVDDVRAGRCEVTRWQVLNLARVWLHPDVQEGGKLYGPHLLPGFLDRHDTFRSTLASTVLHKAMQTICFDYLFRRPPVFLDEPYEIRWLLSYCDTRLHRGTIYRAAGFELYRTNGDGIQTWRIRLPGLTVAQDAMVKDASLLDRRARSYRAKRAQLKLEL